MVQNLTNTSVTFTNITLTWDELSCVNRNGALTGYRIEYGTTTFNNMETVTGTSFIATSLCPHTAYMFRVAAVNGNGIGSYSTTVNRMILSSGNSTTLHTPNIRHPCFRIWEVFILV